MQGGAIYNSGTATLSSCTFSSNTAVIFCPFFFHSPFLYFEFTLFVYDDPNFLSNQLDGLTDDALFIHSCHTHSWNATDSAMAHSLLVITDGRMQGVSIHSTVSPPVHPLGPYWVFRSLFFTLCVSSVL